MMDRATPTMRPLSNNLSSQMAALEAAANDVDEESSQSPSESNGNKGKMEIKQESTDGKQEMDEDTNMTDNNSNSGSGKHNTEEMSGNVKTEIKSEMNDRSDNSASGSTESLNQIKEEVKDEPMSPSNETRSETKAVVPEPIESNETDKKKKCCKYFFILFFLFCLCSDEVVKISSFFFSCYNSVQAR